MKGSNRNNVALTIAGAKRSSFGVKCYQELGLQSLKQWRWCGKLCFFFKMIKKQIPKYLCNLIPTARQVHYKALKVIFLIIMLSVLL